MGIAPLTELAAIPAAGATQGAPRPVRASAPIHLRLLGGFAIEADGAAMPLPAHEQRLVAYLGLHAPVSRSVAAGTLWPAVPELRAMGNLRSTLWRLKRTGPALVVPSRDGLALSCNVSIDVRQLVILVGTLLSGSTAATPVAESIVGSSFGGDLLPGWYDDWVIGERDRLQQLQIHALEASAATFLAGSRYFEALQAALAAVRTDPLRESAQRLIMRIHVAQGNHVEAQRQFRTFRALLAAELGLEPSPETWSLVSGRTESVTRR